MKNLDNRFLTRFYYVIIDDETDEEGVIVSSHNNPEEAKKLIFYFQAKVYNDICDNIHLDKEDVSNLLTQYYGFRRERLFDANQRIETIELISVWDEMIDSFDKIFTEAKYQNIDVEDELLEIIEEHDNFFIFINAATNLPNWVEDIYIEPLTMKVTHNGVLIQGLELLSDEEADRIQEFYPKAKFFDANTLFFNFKDFPPEKYTFGWNGRHITIQEVQEYPDKPTEIIRQMNIGYYLNTMDMRLPIKTLKDLQMLKKKMRLL
ncbi:hypothetical protein [Natronincola ferrireducens]|uniref:Uncharacterized protein n=1 Tax=Natronincola ferrireducens TaxID=393762 RepID=A0A1G9FTJ6_9FIRM|nr:hypothetical protein [Natronincola ferrireducens]SDK91700.1 hypothetical protein SAMN05660472_02244 [Natronincola ferrireducens]